MGINLNLTQLALWGGGALVVWYMYMNKIPPFDQLNFDFDFGKGPGIEEVPDSETGNTGEIDVIPGKEGIVADFYNGSTDYPAGGGTSGDLEDDFFITLARQKALLGDTPYGSNQPTVSGDPELYQKNPALGSNYNNITFDKYGNLVVVPIPQNATDVSSCQNSCMVSCGNMYNFDPAQKEACESGCSRVCSSHYTPPHSAQFPPYDQYGYSLQGIDPYQNQSPYGGYGYAGKKLHKGWSKKGKHKGTLKTKKPFKGKGKGLYKPFKGKGHAYGRNRVLNAPKSFISRYASKINSTMPIDEIEINGVVHRERQLNIKSLIQAKMMLRPQSSSRNMLKLTVGKSEVSNV